MIKQLKYFTLVFLVWLAAMVFAVGLLGIGGFEGISSANPLLFLASAGVFWSANTVWALNWGMLNRLLGVKARIRNVLQCAYAGFFVDNILPTIAPGGEATMALLLAKKEGANPSKTLTAVIVQSMTWFVGFIGFSLTVLLLLTLNGAVGTKIALVLLALLGIFGLILAFIVYMAFSPSACKGLMSWLLGNFFWLIKRFTHHTKAEVLRWASQRIDSFGKMIRIFGNKKKALALSTVIMVFHHSLAAFSFYLALLSAGIATSPGIAALVFMLTVLVSLISLVPGGLGIFEITGTGLMGLSAPLGASALGITLVRLVQYWSVVFVGGFFAVKLGLERIPGGGK